MSEIPFRVGLGHDTHRLESGRRLIVGGMELESDLGAVGHSDGDVLLHAVTDALLGAAGLGDIGGWFPDTDNEWKDADSSKLLATVVAEIHQREWKVGNLDCTIFLERPKLAPHKANMESKLAKLLQIDDANVNVKAKTGENVGPIGRRESIAAEAIVLLVQESNS